MSEASGEFVQAATVRNLIFAYERQTTQTDSFEEHHHYGERQRAKSIGNVLSYKQFRQKNMEIHNLIDIEKELVKIEAHLNYYELYEKETHVAFQEQLFNILTSIVSIDPEGHESTIQMKRELIGETQKMAKILNGKLPYEGMSAAHRVKRVYANNGRRAEEAIVSTTSSQTHKATLNGNFKSEDSLISTHGSTDMSRHEDNSSVDFSKSEQEADASQTKEPAVMPSVSRLKKFFSFRRDEKPTIKVLPATYSGVSRSQTFSVKSGSSRVTVTKRERKSEEISNDVEEIAETPQNNSEAQLEESVILEEPDNNQEVPHNVSVSNLKHLFEEKNKETEEGNYMNFTGLLRNVDIKKNVDINKSKSMSDLKSHSYQKLKSTTDLSKEIDSDGEDNNSNHAEHEKETTEVEEHKGSSYDEEQKEFVIGKVEIVKKVFEELSSSVHSNETHEDIKHIIHRTVKAEEPYLKVDVQLRMPVPAENEEEVVENGGSFEEIQTQETIHSPEHKDVVSSGTVENLVKTFEINTAEASQKVDQLRHQMELSIAQAESCVVQQAVVLEASSHEHEITRTTESEELIQSTEARKYSVVDANSNHLQEAEVLSATNEEHEINLVNSGSVEALKRTFENLSRSTSLEVHDDSVQSSLVVEEIIEDETQSAPAIVELNTDFEDMTVPQEIEVEIAQTDPPSPVSISLYKGNAEANRLDTKEQTAVSRVEHIEAKSESLMKLPDPQATVSITVVSAGEQSQQHHHVSTSKSFSSSSQHSSSSVVSQKVTVSSSSKSKLRSMNYLQVLKSPALSPPRTFNENTTNGVEEYVVEDEEIEAAQLEKTKISLKVSQEDLLDEVLNSEPLGDDDVDEEFERMMKESK